MSELKFEPGIYSLSRNVKNPKPDRRKTREWSQEPIWEAGTLFSLKHKRYWCDDDDERSSKEVNDINLVRASSVRSLPTRSEQFKALAPYLVREAPSLDEVLERHDNNDKHSTHRYILEALVELGVVSLDGIEAAILYYEKKADERYEREKALRAKEVAP